MTTFVHIVAMGRTWVLAALPLLASALGCSSEIGTTITSLYSAPQSLETLDGETWLDHPWPSDVRLENGSPVFRGFYNPGQVLLVEEYIQAAEGLLGGFSPVAGGYLRFSGPLDPMSVPQNATESLLPRASVFLLNVDPDSPDFGLRRPIEVSVRNVGGRYVLPNTLRWIPSAGFSLRLATRYALVVTHTVRSEDGGEILPAEPLREVLELTAPTENRGALAQDLAPVIEAIEAHGARRHSIRHLSVFTTDDPVAETVAVADHVRSQVAPPNFIADREPWVRLESSSHFVEYRAMYGPNPNYQAGELPFAQYGDGGAFNFNEDGRAGGRRLLRRTVLADGAEELRDAGSGVADRAVRPRHYGKLFSASSTAATHGRWRPNASR